MSCLKAKSFSLNIASSGSLGINLTISTAARERWCESQSFKSQSYEVVYKT
ncbi:hypothetical protein VIBNISOn1_480021 [Vibrio nigripulchritudo SOn1]|uniref:Uncharacterized protein n=1 Tax=Vibrio nigripulchritudo SOn1 TaxID=1238450 RepID=A0AAV2VUB0_9VIBR|nr:hypothetical protein VIBNISOn1_480021 [Vibrio nigripulchritudo SOn1]